MTGKVFSINIGKEKGKPKDMVREAVLKEGFGFEGDVHAGPGNRQVSLLAIEEIEVVEAGPGAQDIDFHPGVFAENITTEDLDLTKAKVADRLVIGDSVILKITQIGKDCHNGCSIMREVGQCIMPRQGIFASVEKGGLVKVNDRILLEKEKVVFPWLKR